MTGLPGQSAAGPLRHRSLRDLAQALSVLLRLSAGTSGMIVAFDDADLLAPRGHELLAEVRSRLAGVPVGWLLAGRPEGNWASSPYLLRAASSPVIALRPLNSEEVRQWLTQAWSREPSAQEGQGVWDRTGGLPARLSVLGQPEDIGLVPPAAAASPGIPEPARLWLAAAAITATNLEIDPAVVARMLSLSDADADRFEAAAVGALPLETSSGLRFRHDSWRAKVVSELDHDPATARWLHRRAFEVLGELARSAPGPEPALLHRIAQHARDAGRDVSEQELARACLAVARADCATFAPESAIAWAKVGLRSHCELKTRFDLLLTLGDAQYDRGDMASAGNQYLEARDLAGGQPLWQATAVVHMARRWSDPGQADDDLLHLLRTSIEMLEGHDEAEANALRLRLIAHLSHKSTMAIPAQAIPAQSNSGTLELDSGVSLARRALAELGPDLPANVVCEVLNECRWGIYDYAAPSETLAVSERFYAASLSTTRSALFRSDALIALALDQLRIGPISRAEDTIAKHRRQITASHRPLGEWLQGTLDTVVDLWHGRFDAAEARIFGESLRAVQEAQTAKSMPADTLQQTWQGQAFWLLRERGQMRDIVESGITEEIAEHAYFPIWRAALIMACCDIGRTDEASDRLAALLADTRDLATLPPHGWSVPMLAMLAESCGALHDAGAADAAPSSLIPRLEELLGPHSDEIVLAGWPVVLLGPVSRYQGVLALAAGDHARAIAHFDRALPIVGDSRAQVTRLRLDKAKALAASGGDLEAGEAVRLASQARAEAGRLGMTPIAEHAQALLANREPGAGFAGDHE